MKKIDAWKHKYSETIFSSADECVRDESIYIFKKAVSDCTYGGEFHADDFIKEIQNKPELQDALKLIMSSLKRKTKKK
jgi:hypothetical protein